MDELRSDLGMTIREEANALTALAFRNGFIEQLHAGCHHEVLDDPDISRITDDEMKTLMIQASEQLARLLSYEKLTPKNTKRKSSLAHATLTNGTRHGLCLRRLGR